MKVNHKYETASPLLNRTALSSIQTEAQSKKVPTFSLMFNMLKTKARSEIAEKIFHRNRSLGRPDPYFHLDSETNIVNEKGYMLRANGNEQHVVYPHGKYPYVVLSSSQGEYELRIGQMHHYYLAGKKPVVLAAGEILFANVTEGPSAILSINDHSGGYHINEEEDELVRSFKRLSISNVLESVGLPVDKFCSIDNPKASPLTRRHSL